MSAFRWVLLTRGDRIDALRRAVDSVGSGSDLPLVVANGVEVFDLGGADVVAVPENLGVPGGRAAGVDRTDVPIVGFLDDDAVLRTPDAIQRCLAAFDGEADLAVITMRLVDEDGNTARRHNPRFGRRGRDEPGDVVTFLGGASAIRRSAYEEVGGYWGELFYGHEELDLSWRLADAGFRISYMPSVEVFHPRTEIGRHRDGWRLTGRNRVWIARRNLPWPIAITHVGVWLVAGLVRAPADCRRAYVSGWWSGWRTQWGGDVVRRPISWRTVWRLTRLGRPPVI